MRLLLAAMTLLAVPGPGAGEEGPALPVHDLGYRAARWGMTPGEVLAAFPGEAVALQPPLSLPDGNAVAVELPVQALAGEQVRARFVFAGGRLALVGLRTPEDRYAGPEAYAAVRAALAATLGFGGAESRDDSLIDLRQTRWILGRSAVDLRYIPGVVSVVWFPWPPPPEVEARPAVAGG